MARRAGAWIAIYCRRKDAFLLARRSKYVKNPYHWNFFGGQVDPGETPRKAAIRELREEAGIRVAKADVTSLGTIQLNGPGYTGEERELHFFLVLVDVPIKPLLNHENSEYRWFQSTGLPLSVNPPTRTAVNEGIIGKAVDYARKHGGKSIIT